MKNHRFKSVKTKLILLITLVISIISLFVFIYFPNRIEQQQINSISKRVEALAQIASYSVASAVYFNDKDVTKEQIDALILSEDIEYILITTPRDPLYFQYNFTSAVDSKNYELNGQDFSNNRNVYRTKKNIELNDKILGTLYLGYSLKVLNNEVSNLKSSIAIVSLIIFLLGLIAVYYIGSYITKPITSMVKTVELIRAGDLTKRSKLNTKDEIGYLSKSFNSMVDRIEESNEEMELINKDLENRVLERTRELAQSEERFRGLYENSTIGIYRTTPDGKLLLANTALIKMLGFNSIEELNKIDYVSHGFDDPKDRQYFMSEIEKKGVIIGLEQKWIKKDGTKIFIRESARAVRDDRGNTVYYDGTVEDITTKKMMEDELITAKEKAESAVKIKTEFLAQMSHEIRTPINSILSYAQLLKDETFNTIPDELKFSFDMINSGGRRLIRTVDLILNMSELQTGTYEPIFEECNIVEILKQLVGEFKTAADSKELDLIFINRLERSESIIVADIYTITQIFANLIDNAVKYTNQGSIEVVAFKNNENKFCVDVQDSGIGISKKFQETLFEAFSQEEQGYTRKFDGNGLGMSLVKEYCKINNAKISVVSEKGKGSNFTVVFQHIIDAEIVEKNQIEKREIRMTPTIL